MVTDLLGMGDFCVQVALTARIVLAYGHDSRGVCVRLDGITGIGACVQDVGRDVLVRMYSRGCNGGVSSRIFRP